MKLHSSQFWTSREGSSLVEFTLVLPVLVLLALGVAEFGNTLYGTHVIATGIRDAARYVARLDDPMASQTAAKQLAVMGEIGGSTKRLAWWNTDDVSVSVSTVANPLDPNTGTRPYRGGDTIKIVRVATNATYPGLGFRVFVGLSSTLGISMYHEERVIGD